MNDTESLRRAVTRILSAIKRARATRREQPHIVKKVKGVVLFHGGGLNSSSFDVLVRKEYEDKYRWVKGYLYEVDCPYVTKFLEKNQNYIYLASGDFDVFCADEVVRILSKLINDGFETMCVGGEGQTGGDIHGSR